ncbi:hypothetical protein VYU27_009281 [Nannochloropsis oceanica]
MNIGPGVSTTALTRPASSSNNASTARTSTSTSSHGHDGSKTNEARPQVEETFTATLKRQSIISTVEMLTLQCCDYRGRCEALEDRVRELEAEAAAASNASTSTPVTCSNTSNNTDKAVIERQSKEIRRLESELQAAQRALARAASLSSAPAIASLSLVDGAAKIPAPAVLPTSMLTSTLATDLGPEEWRTSNDVEYIVEQQVRDEIANFTTDKSERLRLQNAMAAALGPVFPQRRVKLGFDHIKAFVEGCLLLLKHGAFDSWVSIVYVEAESASRRTRRSVKAGRSYGGSDAARNAGSRRSSGVDVTITTTTTAPSSSSNNSNCGGGSINGNSASTSNKSGTSSKRNNSASNGSTDSPISPKLVTHTTAISTTSTCKSNSWRNSGSSDGGGNGGPLSTFKKPSAATATGAPPAVVRKRGRPSNTSKATSMASSSSPSPKRHVLIMSSTGADSLSNRFYEAMNERVYQVYKTRNTPLFIASVFQDLFPKGLPFATVDAFFTRLAISEELQLVLAQAREVHKNRNIQYDKFVKRLMEMAGLSPNVLRAMYASRMDEAEKGGK